uniref:Uncharacterized protein n=1 Tax=Kalanchoe fedtschenkoi TaxID=63787 RepID=A0A7N0U3H1_KALFE
MPSGTKRRKAAKKKREKTQTAISNGNGGVKVVESDGGENSSPASQDFEPQQNPFTKYEEKQPSVGNGKIEDGSLRDSNGNGKTVDLVAEAESQNGGKASSLSDSDGDGEVVEIAGEAESQNGGKAGVVGVEDSNGKLTAEPEINIVAETEAFGEEVVQAEDSAPVARVAGSNKAAVKKAVQVQVQVRAPLSLPAEKLVGPAPAEPNSKKHEEKLHPSNAFSDSEEPGAEWLTSSNNKLGQPSEETVQIDHLQPLLRTVPRQADKTSWTGCCGLLELFTGSSG